MKALDQPFAEKNREWLALDHPSVADVAAYPAIAHAGDGDISLDGFNAIQAWLARVEKLPGFIRLLDGTADHSNSAAV